jgi:hypothetical protein
MLHVECGVDDAHSCACSVYDACCNAACDDDGYPALLV